MAPWIWTAIGSPLRATPIGKVSVGVPRMEVGSRKPLRKTE